MRELNQALRICDRISGKAAMPAAQPLPQAQSTRLAASMPIAASRMA